MNWNESLSKMGLITTSLILLMPYSAHGEPANKNSKECKPTAIRTKNNLDLKSNVTQSTRTKLLSQNTQPYNSQPGFGRPTPAIQNPQGPFYRQYSQQPQPPILTNGTLLVTTTNNVPGYRVIGYKGMVRGDVVFGPTIIQAFKSSLKSIIGGKIGGYTQMCQRARQNAYDDMLNQARQLGANAIIGVQYDSSTFRTSKDGDVGTEVFCYGTAVSIAPL